MISGSIAPKEVRAAYFRPPLPFLFGACVSADAATLFTALGVRGLESSFAAFVATDFDVRSLRAIAFKRTGSVAR